VVSAAVQPASSWPSSKDSKPRPAVQGATRASFIGLRSFTGLLDSSHRWPDGCCLLIDPGGDLLPSVDCRPNPAGHAQDVAGFEGHSFEPGERIGQADLGGLYTPIIFTEHLEFEGMHPSIWAVTGACDNALMKTVTGLLITEYRRAPALHAEPSCLLETLT